MGFRFATLLCLAALCTQSHASLLSKSASLKTAPAFAWSSQHGLQHADDQSSSRVVYEDVDSTELISMLWTTLSRDSDAAQSKQHSSPDALVMLVGNQLHLGSLSSKKDQPAFQALQDSLRAAGSALSIPALSSQGQGLQHEVIAALKQKIPAMQISAACSDPAANLEQPAELLQKLTNQQVSGPKAVVVCVPAQADWTLASETAYLDSLSTATKAAFPRNIMAYISDSTTQAPAAAGTSRSLLQSMELPQQVGDLQLPSFAASLSVPDTYLCDDKCFTQVRVIEVFILFVTILTALLSGICMLNVLGTPTKFETAKDARQSHE